jgi:hypothetical protein
VVPGAEWGVDLAAHGGDVDDLARPVLAHVRQDELGQPSRAEDVDLELVASLVHRDVLNRAVGAVAGVVHEHVNATRVGNDLFDSGLQRGVVGDVHGDGVDARLGEVVRALDAAGGGVDGVAGLGEFEGGGFADAGGGAGDEGDFVRSCWVLFLGGGWFRTSRRRPWTRGIPRWSQGPSNLTAGNWKVGVVVDDAASDEQTQALERILSGQEGGTFGELAQLITEFLGTERGAVSFSDGETPTGAVGDKTEIRSEPKRGVDGLPTTVKDAAFGVRSGIPDRYLHRSL